MKKILIISHNAISKTSNNGKTIRSLFEYYDKNDISQLYFHGSEEPDYDFISEFYHLSLIRHLKTLFKLKFKKNTNHFSESRVNVPKSFYSFSIILRDLLWDIIQWDTKSLRIWLKNFDPKIIFFVGGNSTFSHKIALNISRRLGIPLAVFFTDDYIIYPLSRNIIDKLHKRRLKKYYSKTIKHSKLHFGIGEMMCDEYSKYYKQTFFPIMNSIEIRETTTKNLDRNIVISYFGGLHLNRDNQIIKFAEICNNIFKDSNYKITFKVYSGEVPSNFISEKFDKHNIKFMGFVNENIIQECISEATFLFHVESDEMYYRHLTRLSISTKIPEYLISMRPIIAFGPIEVASMQLLQNNGLGIVISSEENIEVIEKKLISAFSDPIDYEKLAKKSYRFAKSYFNKEENSSLFLKKLNSLWR